MVAIETIHAGNHRFPDSDLQWYALLEGAHPAHNTLDLVYKNLMLPEWVAIYQFAPYEALTKVSPVLIKLARPSEWLERWQQEFPDLAGSMFSSEKGIDPVVSHLRTMVSVRVEGGTDAIFRFHDSWIARALYSSLDDTEKARFHGPVCQWLWFLGENVSRAERLENVRDVSQLSEGWLELSAKHQQAIQDGLVSKRNWKESQQ